LKNSGTYGLAMSIKRSLANFVEAALNVRIVRPDVVGLLFEEFHLKRVFDLCDVDCVFDVGANWGQYAEKLRQRVGYRGEIISFEPNPNVVDGLREKATNDPKWHVVDIALDRTAGPKTFNIMIEDQMSSLLAPSESEVVTYAKINKVTQHRVVETRTLSQEYTTFAQQIEFKHPFLKMDTQGNDVAIARGGEAVLRNFVAIQTELAVKRLYCGTPDFGSTLEYFRSMGFELSALVPNNEGDFPQLIEIDAILLRDDLIS
jgi:FkbM family methyltransferase